MNIVIEWLFKNLLRDQKSISEFFYSVKPFFSSYFELYVCG